MSEWQLIATAPKDEQVLVWTDTGVRIAEDYGTECGWFSGEVFLTEDQGGLPTHWMPLPEAPPRTPHEMMAEAMIPGTQEMHVTQEEMDAMMEHARQFVSISCPMIQPGVVTEMLGPRWYLKEPV